MEKQPAIAILLLDVGEVLLGVDFQGISLESACLIIVKSAGAFKVETPLPQDPAAIRSSNDAGACLISKSGLL